MRRRASVLGCACVALALSVGCQPAHRFEDLPPSSPARPQTLPGDTATLPPPQPLDPHPGWIIPVEPPGDDLPIVFISPEAKEWAELPEYWNEPTAAHPRVRIKVPLGLDDPTPHIPAANPPTVRKWALGKKLFFDPKWLQPSSVSCATCHRPAYAYARNPASSEGPLDRLDTPALVNGVFNNFMFWDGRGGSLEEVLPPTAEDAISPPFVVAGPTRHVWPRVVNRLRDGPYKQEFVKVFGTQPTLDAAGKALATYLRTALSGNSLHDRAVAAARQARNSSDPTRDDYLKVLDAAALDQLGRKGSDREQIAGKLQDGYRVFTGKGRCAVCHSGRNFTDNGFHNIGIGAPRDWPRSGEETGRFASLPIGRKDRAMIAAFKTPTLRDLPRSDPYFHDGSGRDIDQAIREHFEGGFNPFLDRELRDPADPSQRRPSPLTPDDIDALILFLRALRGEDLPHILTDPTTSPPSVSRAP